MHKLFSLEFYLLAVLVNAIERLFRDSALAQSLGTRARQFVVAHHGREAMLDKMEAIFNAVQT